MAYVFKEDEFPKLTHVQSSRRGCQQDGVSYIGIANNERRLVLIGTTGVGKSATGNTLLGEKAFQSKASHQSVTKACHFNTTMRFGRKLVIVDTPSLFDTKTSHKETGDEIAKCIRITAPGPHAFIIVVQIGRFTEEERATVEQFSAHFGEGLFKYTIVLFTRKEDLEDEERTLEEYIKDVDGFLKDILQKSGNRCIAFNNRAEQRAKDEDVKRLLDMIEQILVDNNNGSFYKNEMYEAAEKITQARIQRNLIEEEDRKKKEFKVISDQIASQFQFQIDQMHAEHKLAVKQLERQRQEREMEEILREKKELEKNLEEILCEQKELEKKLRSLEEREKTLREKKERQEMESEIKRMKYEFMRENKKQERDKGRLYEEKKLLIHHRDPFSLVGKALSSSFKDLFK